MDYMLQKAGEIRLVRHHKQPLPLPERRSLLSVARFAECNLSTRQIFGLPSIGHSEKSCIWQISHLPSVRH